MNRSLLLGAVAASALLADAVPAAAGSILATPEQLAAERVLAQVQADPRVRAAVLSAEASLATDPAAARPEGKATLKAAVESWTAALIYQESGDPRRPAFLLSAEDTPRTWFGQSAPGAANAGDNPDNVYRVARLDGAGRYEIRGRVPAPRPIQFSFEVSFITGAFKASKATADSGNQVAFLADTEIRTDAAGTFVITLDDQPANGRPNHIQLAAGPLQINFRNTFSDWRQSPVAVTLSRLDDARPAPVIAPDAVAARVAANLPALMIYRSSYKEGWLGGPTPNTLGNPVPRDGGWGYITGGRYDLADDEGLLITTTDGGARYTGVQISDRWFVTPDNRHCFTSLNNSQVVKSADGSVTYVIAPRDPGVVNWISTNGLHQGFLILRWQQAPQVVAADKLLRTVEVVKLSDIRAKLPEGPWVIPTQRVADLRARATSYEQRFKAGS